MPNLLRYISDLILQRRCCICSRRLESQEEHLCFECATDLPLTRFHLETFNNMEQRLAGKIRFERASAYMYYQRGSRSAEVVHGIKYKNRPELATYLGILLSRQLLPTGFFQDIDCILPIPLHYTKRQKRGYNQSEYFAKGICQITHIPIYTDYLSASREHSTQTKHTSTQRFENMQGVFTVRHSERLEGKHCLLVDDVFTTGATLISATTEINKIKDTRVSILTISVTKW